MTMDETAVSALRMKRGIAFMPDVGRAGYVEV